MHKFAAICDDLVSSGQSLSQKKNGLAIPQTKRLILQAWVSLVRGAVRPCPPLRGFTCSAVCARLVKTIQIKMADEGRSLPMFVVDAFTNKPFGGNPAAVCLVGSEVSCLPCEIYFSWFFVKDVHFRHASCSVKCPGRGGGGGILPYMSYIGMCRCEGYGFQRVYSRIGYRNQRVLV